MDLRRNLILLLAAAAGISVANLYYNQPLLVAIGATFSATPRQVGLIATLTQAGYAAGMLAFVPLSDLLERRRLIVMLQVTVAVALAACAAAPAYVVLVAASFAVGLFTVAPQVIMPYAAGLADPRARGRVVGQVYTGLLLGILLARTLSGAVGQFWGWRAMYWIAAVGALLLALVLRLRLPKSAPPAVGESYGGLMRSLWRMTLEHPELRESAMIGGAMFGAFSAFWTTLALRLAQPPFGYGPGAAGVFGLVGAAGALAAPVAGRFADRRGPRFVIGLAIATTVASFAVFWVFGNSIAGLIVGVLVLDVGVQASQVSNQTRIFALAPGAQGRANTVYMITYFTGGAVGSYLSAAAWGRWGWSGVCAVGAVLALVAGLVHVMSASELKSPRVATRGL